MYTHLDTLGMLADDYIRERHEEARRDARAREAVAARGVSRGWGIYGRISHALGVRSGLVRPRAAAAAAALEPATPKRSLSRPAA